VSHIQQGTACLHCGKTSKQRGKRVNRMTSQTNIQNVVRIADGVETNDPAVARKLRQWITLHADERDVAREIFRQRRAARRANNQARG